MLNDAVATLNENTTNQVNTTNTGVVTAFWKHFSLLSGSTCIVNLLPALTPITLADNIIFANNSLPVHAVSTNYLIVTNNTGGLICLDFDVSARRLAAGQLQKMAIRVSTDLQICCISGYRLLTILSISEELT